MKSLKELYRIGLGPSSSHTMGPRFAAQSFAKALPENAARIRVTLYGSLAATGRGHLTDLAVSEPFAPRPVELVWLAEQVLPRHPNALQFEALDEAGAVMATRIAYSVGGGALIYDGEQSGGGREVYPYASMREILDKAEGESMLLWEVVDQCEGPEVWPFLADIWMAMQRAIKRGLNAEGRLPGSLNVPRKASAYHARAQSMAGYFGQTALLFAYALAVSEENAAGGEIVTAPTCGACGVLPAVLYFLKQQSNLSDEKICRALATAGLIGNLIKRNASISGAEVGCQGEVGSACAMAAAGLTEVLGGTPEQVENAAEIGLEHNLGLTCDPVGGLVQVPCIERNAMASIKAINAAQLALRGDGAHAISLDQAIRTMRDTGRDMLDKYKETSRGGLAVAFIEC